MADPAIAAARDEAERLGVLVGSDVDRVEDDLLREDRDARRIHRYTIEETWGDCPEWVAEMVGQPEAFILDTYRGKVSQWEVERGGEIVYGFAGDYAGVSPVALAQQVDA